MHVNVGFGPQVLHQKSISMDEKESARRLIDQVDAKAPFREICQVDLTPARYGSFGYHQYMLLNYIVQNEIHNEIHLESIALS